MSQNERAHDDEPVDIEPFLERVSQWALRHPEIAAVSLVGSYARNDATPSSDIDLILRVDDPATFIRDPAWISALGTVIRSHVEDWGRVQSVRVWYEEGPEVEFGVTDRGWGEDPEDRATLAVIEAGHRIVYVRGKEPDAGGRDALPTTSSA